MVKARNLIPRDFFSVEELPLLDTAMSRTRLRVGLVGRMTTLSIINFVDSYPRGKYTHVSLETDLQIGHLPPKSESMISMTDELLSKNGTLSHDNLATMNKIHSLYEEISFPSQLAGYES